MVQSFLYGLIQGVLLATLAGALLPGLFGSILLALDFMVEGFSAYTEIIILLVVQKNCARS